jgi:hypothetical protein
LVLKLFLPARSNAYTYSSSQLEKLSKLIEDHPSRIQEFSSVSKKMKPESQTE